MPKKAGSGNEYGLHNYTNTRLVNALNRIATESKAEYDAAQERLEYYHSEREDSPMKNAFNLLAGIIEKRDKRSYIPDEYWELLAEAKKRGLVTRKGTDGAE